MKRKFWQVTAVLFSITTFPAFGYVLKRENGSECREDGSTCIVYCDNKQVAGSMNWNGNVWTDGVKSDADKDRMAQKIVAANGSACV